MAILKPEELRLRRPGDPNPYVIGTERYVRFLQIQLECTRFAIGARPEVTQKAPMHLKVPDKT